MEEFPTSKGISLDSRRPYSVKERLDTFKESHWPFERGSCTPLKVRKPVSTIDD